MMWLRLLPMQLWLGWLGSAFDDATQHFAIDVLAYDPDKALRDPCNSLKAWLLPSRIIYFQLLGKLGLFLHCLLFLVIGRCALLSNFFSMEVSLSLVYFLFCIGRHFGKDDFQLHDFSVGWEELCRSVIPIGQKKKKKKKKKAFDAALLAARHRQMQTGQAAKDRASSKGGSLQFGIRVLGW